MTQAGLDSVAFLVTKEIEAMMEYPAWMVCQEMMAYPGWTVIPGFPEAQVCKKKIHMPYLQRFQIVTRRFTCNFATIVYSVQRRV